MLLYVLYHQSPSQFIEGDEVYTKVNEYRPLDQSKGWTITLMDRASRFL